MKNSVLKVNVLSNLFFLTLTVLFLASSCTFKSYQRHIGVINDIPIEKSKKNPTIDLFFENELPKEPFIKVTPINFVGRLQDDARSMVGKVKSYSQNIGFDAVIYIKQGNVNETNFTLADVLTNSDGYNYAASTLTGIGVKYVKNLEHIYSSRKKATVYPFQNSLDSLNDTNALLSVSYNLFGEFIKEEKILSKSTFYLSEIATFDLKRLVEEQKDWKYDVESPINFPKKGKK
jgi:hypothetical protein